MRKPCENDLPRYHCGLHLPLEAIYYPSYFGLHLIAIHLPKFAAQVYFNAKSYTWRTIINNTTTAASNSPYCF
jgi:hypothetical protein